MSGQYSLVDRVAERFEPNETGYTYWVRPFSEGYDVSTEQRDEILASFNRSLTHRNWIALVVMGLGALIFFCFSRRGPLGDWTGDIPAEWAGAATILWIVILGQLAGRLFPFRPEEWLRSRPRRSRPTTRADQWRHDLREATWWSLGGEAALLSGIVFVMTTQPSTGNAGVRWTMAALLAAMLVRAWYRFGWKVYLAAGTRKSDAA